MSHVYHFSLGNSTDGPIGFCANIKADSEEQAVERLKQMLPIDGVWDTDADAMPTPDGMDIRNEYIAAYFNDEKITVDDIDMVDESDIVE